MTGDTNLNLFVLRKDVDFGFAFGDTNFSDRILNIQIVNEANAVDMSAVGPEAHIMNQPDNIRDDMDTENQAEETAAMIGEPASGDEGARANDIDSNRSMECSTIPRVKTLHISSPILAAKSPFFYKLFSNGMRESEQRHATLQIKASEEGALMELLNFMYSNTLKVTTAAALLDVLMIADKFEVTSCMRYCICSLRNVPMTPECALLYLDLPSSVPTAEGVQPLIDAAKQFLVVHDKDITKFYDAALNLPLAEVEAILASDDLQVASEDAVYDFVLKWSRFHYPKIEEREIVATYLAQFIRYPYMSCQKLRNVMACKDFEHEFAQKVVVEALFFKAQAPHKQQAIVAQESLNPNRRFVQRAYKYRPVKVVEFELPTQCEVYLDLKREQCAKLFPSGRVFSEAFHLGGQGFFLSAHCNMNKQSSFHCFGMYLGMQENGSVTLVDYEFAVRSKPTEEYINKYKGNHTFTGGAAVGYRNLFATSWTSFMAEDSPYFINGVLHLRAKLTIRH